jgi:hypothetical protein
MNGIMEQRPTAISTAPEDCQTVTTLALLIRKNGMSRALFSRYWRDVHGVLAARIPGFESYVQYHLDQPFDDLLPQEADGNSRVPATAHLDGLAEVTFQNAAKRIGLATSDVTAMIQQDEQNVFRTSLLFNLSEGASQTVLKEPVAAQSSMFMLLGSRPGCTRDSVSTALNTLLLPSLRAMEALCGLRIHMLLSGEQESWRTEGVDNRQTSETAFDAIVQLDFASEPGREIVRQALAAVPPALYQILPRLQVYPVRACHVMVDGGKPTELGLRGLDAQRTIAEAGASNQRSEEVLRCVFGDSAFGTP